MTPKKVGALVVGICIIIGLGATVLFGKKTQIEQPAPENTNTQEVPSQSTSNIDEPLPAPGTKKIPFAQFFAQGGSYVCTVNQYVENMESKGTTYMHNGMIRGEFSTAMQGMIMDTHMIVRDGFTYTWSSMMPTMGYKVPVQASGEADITTTTNGTYSFNAEQIGDYDCEAWSPDLNRFELPPEVTFKVI